MCFSMVLLILLREEREHVERETETEEYAHLSPTISSFYFIHTNHTIVDIIAVITIILPFTLTLTHTSGHHEW